MGLLMRNGKKEEPTTVVTTDALDFIRSIRNGLSATESQEIIARAGHLIRILSDESIISLTERFPFFMGENNDDTDMDDGEETESSDGDDESQGDEDEIECDYTESEHDAEPSTDNETTTEYSATERHATKQLFLIFQRDISSNLNKFL
ncbi:hypothetical protein MP638_000481 [Amoeboaphelidium occidentale]|nr:hypothetical protein MP638_000481 [Amoeboaphelidium occidentale]